jgi:hypothetical protein
VCVMTLGSIMLRRFQEGAPARSGGRRSQPHSLGLARRLCIQRPGRLLGASTPRRPRPARRRYRRPERMPQATAFRRNASASVFITTRQRCRSRLPGQRARAENNAPSPSLRPHWLRQKWMLAVSSHNPPPSPTLLHLFHLFARPAVVLHGGPQPAPSPAHSAALQQRAGAWRPP